MRLYAECREGLLQLCVENSVDPDAQLSRKGGMGLANVRQRLEARYGKEASLQSTAEEERFRVVVTIPAELAEAQKPAATLQVAQTKEVGL